MLPIFMNISAVGATAFSSSAILFQAQPQGPGIGVVLIQVAAIFAIFYFLLIRPHRKERKEHEEMTSKLTKGDEIITNGGIIGTIIHAQDERLTIKTGDQTRIVVHRDRIAQKLSELEDES